MELRHLRTMVAIADAGSFAAAGDRVGLSQSAVSLQVKGLEDDLGVALFDRGQRPPKATPAGEALIRHARAVLAETDDLRRALRGGGDCGIAPARGCSDRVLGVAAADPRGAAGLSPRSARRGSERQLRRVSPAPSVRAISTRVWSPSHQQRSRALSGTRLPRASGVVAPRDAAGDTDDELLTGHPFIWFNRNTWAGQQIERQLRVRALEVDAQIEIDHLDAITRLVEAGLGVAIVPVCAGAPPFPPACEPFPFEPIRRTGSSACSPPRTAARPR